MAEIIARFADGRLLVQEDKAVRTETVSGGFCTLRVGNIGTIEKVLSIDAAISGYPDQKLGTELRDVVVSGDTLRVQLRRVDLGSPTLPTTLIVASSLLSGLRGVLSSYQFASCELQSKIIFSGAAGLNQLSGITSGIGYYEPLTSGRPVSGKLRILANVIGY